MAWRVTAEGVIKSTMTLPVEEIMFGDFLDRLFRRHSDRVAMIDTETGQQYTYGDLLRMVKSIAAGLQARGVKPHDIVVLCARTSVKSCCYLLALLFCQATILATKPSYSAYELKGVLERFSSTKLVLGDESSCPNLLQATDGALVLNLEENWDLSRAADFKHPGVADPKSSVMFMCLTSGSTGPSKAVCISHFNSIGNLTQWKTSFSRLVMCNPISHLSGAICFYLTIGNAETVFMAPENLTDDVEKYLDVCDKYGIETGLTLPAHFTNLTKFGRSNKLDSVKHFLTGGSTIPQSLIDEFRSLYPHIFVEVVYGSSEAGINLRSVDQENILHLAVITNIEVKIVDIDTDEILGPNQNGMLYCRSPSVALGYYNNEEATKEVFKDGWHITGDLAFRDDEGRVVIVDRLKQLIKCMDKQVVPADLELPLSKDRDVLKALVGGVPHEVYGEAAVAFVVPRKTSDLQQLRQRLLKEVETKCAFYKRLHGGLFFVETIPEGAGGKFSRKEIVRRHLKKEIEYIE
ncbi:4-coumarate--CoA ligase-like 6 [Galendromus occidentalis]|uniref:4-coumarate--CoA ligase-like 6 n=1 Tax=Galendromus occidentalis TaxID=34638 RepID=A0AAJ6QMV7_9ACAR|nr:4-coumarate--CoA ligase-like 6 [Galendromus occidentalis]